MGVCFEITATGAHEKSLLDPVARCAIRGFLSCGCALARAFGVVVLDRCGGCRWRAIRTSPAPGCIIAFSGAFVVVNGIGWIDVTALHRLGRGGMDDVF
jgi:hypothetical protein